MCRELNKKTEVDTVSERASNIIRMKLKNIRKRKFSFFYKGGNKKHKAVLQHTSKQNHIKIQRELENRIVNHRTVRTKINKKCACLIFYFHEKKFFFL